LELIVPGNTLLNRKNIGVNNKQTFIPKNTVIRVEAPIKLTTSGRGKLTTCFAGEDLVVQVC